MLTMDGYSMTYLNRNDSLNDCSTIAQRLLIDFISMSTIAQRLLIDFISMSTIASEARRHRRGRSINNHGL